MSQPHLSVRVSPDLKLHAEKVAKDKGVPVSVVVTEALLHYFHLEREAEHLEWVANEIKTSLGRQIDEGNKRILKVLGQFDIEK